MSLICPAFSTPATLSFSAGLVDEVPVVDVVGFATAVCAAATRNAGAMQKHAIVVITKNNRVMYSRVCSIVIFILRPV